mmetsp:Transcript_30155/g.45499  ORF Transcript_30155/g.45499 Transcript_30155/m.45499 type:complete len:90 (-) Transcript_30155:924-1193(-)
MNEDGAGRQNEHRETSTKTKFVLEQAFSSRIAQRELSIGVEEASAALLRSVAELAAFFVARDRYGRLQRLVGLRLELVFALRSNGELCE